MKDYVGRATPLYFAKNLSENMAQTFYLKTGDLNHTGAIKSITLSDGSSQKTRKRNYCRNWVGQYGVATYSLRFDEFRMHRLHGRNGYCETNSNVARMKMLRHYCNPRQLWF